MQSPPQNLSIVDWAQILSAVGQCLSAFGALLAALFALISVKEMKKQSDLNQANYRMKIDEFISTNGPILQIQWQDNHQHEPANCLHVFPTNAKAVLVMQDNKPNKAAFEAISLWWNAPANNPSPTKFIILTIRNVQTKPSGVAHSIRGTLGTEVRKRNDGFPQHQIFDLTFEIDKCDPQEEISIPICVEGMPGYHFYIKRLEYKCNYMNKTLSLFSGDRSCKYQNRAE